MCIMKLSSPPPALISRQRETIGRHVNVSDFCPRMSWIFAPRFKRKAYQQYDNVKWSRGLVSWSGVLKSQTVNHLSYTGCPETTNAADNIKRS